MQDANWNVVALATVNGAIQERCAYTAYGTPLFLSAGFIPLAASGHDWEVFYAGYRLDPLGLYQVRHRFLHHRLGNWVSRDPLSYLDSMSLYEYVRGRSLGYLDPFGTSDRPGFPTGKPSKNDPFAKDPCAALNEKGRERIKKAIERLRRDYKYSRKRKLTSKNKSNSGFNIQLQGGCTNARKSLEFLESCIGPLTCEQLDALDMIKDAIDKYCNGNPPPVTAPVPQPGPAPESPLLQAILGGIEEEGPIGPAIPPRVQDNRPVAPFLPPSLPTIPPVPDLPSSGAWGAAGAGALGAGAAGGSIRAGGGGGIRAGGGIGAGRFGLSPMR